MPSPPRGTSRSRAVAVGFALALNAVPLMGVLFFGWSAANLVPLYWVENLFVACSICIRIARHRSLTRKRGHLRPHLGLEVNNQPFEGTFLQEYTSLAFAFTLAHGLFLIGILFWLDERGVTLDWAQLGWGVLAVLAVVLIDLALELPALQRRSFAAIKLVATKGVWRVVVMQITIIGGTMLGVLLEWPLGVLAVLIGLKTLSDLAAALAGDVTSKPAPDAAPGWAQKLVVAMTRNTDAGAQFEQHFAQIMRKTQQEAQDDERVME